MNAVLLNSHEILPKQTNKSNQNNQYRLLPFEGPAPDGGVEP